jgi:hypothetical protein
MFSLHLDIKISLVKKDSHIHASYKFTFNRRWDEHGIEENIMDNFEEFYIRRHRFFIRHGRADRCGC